MNFMAGMCRKINIDKIFNESLQSQNGRRPDISYGTQALMTIVNIVDDKVPLYRMKEYYSDYIDLDGIFKEEIDISQINDDRFGNFLDKFYEANPREIFSKISAYAFATYGIEVKNINYDTTSKVMWSEYDGYDGKHGEISITFGHSKNKRNDKKQIKIGAGVAEGLIVDAKVLSGNTDDKSYNFDNLDGVEEVLDTIKVSKESFYYIADSAAFTENTIKKANDMKIKMITKVPDRLIVTKELKNAVFKELETFDKINFINAQNKEVEYLIKETTFDYNGVLCKGALCYSYALESTKRKSILKKVEAERKLLNKTIKKYSKLTFETEGQAIKLIEELKKGELKKIKFNNLSYQIIQNVKNKPGRQKKDISIEETIKEYGIKINFIELENTVEEYITKSCIFILASTDLEISAEQLLKEYKTQSCVEKKFQQFKSSEFVDALFLKTPQRVEALTYMMLISMMVLSVIEYVTRREMKKENITILGPGDIKMKNPSLNAILIIMKTVPIMVIGIGNNKERRLIQSLKDNQKCVLRCLNLSEIIYI
ncbi:IS1634 family transposase [Dethiothermospora halolimnae]|uniref:IS1634 family transposase n=1 Tax=Dethiothermospora halolimnae TaxID=3114390 RepID=UPI003CCC462E